MATTKDQRDIAKLGRQTERQRDIEWKETLIREVYKYPCIWDKRTKEHRNRQIVDASWEILSKTMERPKDFVKKQWKSLMDHFRNLFTDITKGSKSGDALDPDKLLAVKWPFFQTLMFLKDVVRSRSTICSVVVPEDDDHEVESILSPVECNNQHESSSSDSCRPSDSISESMSAAHFLLPPQQDTNKSSSDEIITPPPTLRHKRSRSGGIRQIVESQKALFGNELRELNKEISQINSSPSDSVDRFTAHMGDIMRDIPLSHRNACFEAVSQVVYNYLRESRTSIILIDDATQQIDTTQEIVEATQGSM